MISSFAKNIINKKAFQQETNLYRVEPLVPATMCWMELKDVSDMKKAKSLHFSELKGKELYAKFVRMEHKSYWRLYIKGVTSLDVVYVQTATLNPIGSYNR